MSVVDQAKKCDPQACWWIKGDTVDVVKESTQGVWSGDTDLDDGELDQLYQSMQKRLAFIRSLGLKGEK